MSNIRQEVRVGGTPQIPDGYSRKKESGIEYERWMSGYRAGQVNGELTNEQKIDAIFMQGYKSGRNNPEYIKRRTQPGCKRAEHFSLEEERW